LLTLLAWLLLEGDDRSRTACLNGKASTDKRIFLCAFIGFLPPRLRWFGSSPKRAALIRDPLEVPAGWKNS
jgi:hypothetical protein